MYRLHKVPEAELLAHILCRGVSGASPTKSIQTPLLRAVSEGEFVSFTFATAFLEFPKNPGDKLIPPPGKEEGNPGNLHDLHRVFLSSISWPRTVPVPADNWRPVLTPAWGMQALWLQVRAQRGMHLTVPWWSRDWGQRPP